MTVKIYRPLFVLQMKLVSLLKDYIFTREEADALIRIINDKVE
jgi:hypothetical protein